METALVEFRLDAVRRADPSACSETCSVCVCTGGVPTVSISESPVHESSSYSIDCSFPGESNVTSLQIQLLNTSLTVYEYPPDQLHSDWQVTLHPRTAVILLTYLLICGDHWIT